ALDRPEDHDLSRPDICANLAVLPDRDQAARFDDALDLAIDDQLLVAADLAFDVHGRSDNCLRPLLRRLRDYRLVRGRRRGRLRRLILRSLGGAFFSTLIPQVRFSSDMVYEKRSIVARRGPRFLW